VLRLKGLCLLICAVSAAAHADSDGHFCFSDNYVAFEQYGPEPGKSGRILSVVPLSSTGIGAIRRVTLDDFQPHGMSCGSKRISITGRRKDYFIDPESLSVTVNDRVAPPRAGGQDLNLGVWTDEGTAEHTVTDRFRVRITKRTTKVPSETCCTEDVHVRSLLVDDLKKKEIVLYERRRTVNYD
jgi:hypothetical protein